MRIQDMRPDVTPWRDGQHRQVSSWSFVDLTDTDGFPVRQVRHYSTLMLEFVQFDWSWRVLPLSVGHGTVSDQGGMNQLMDGYRYHRDQRGGGPRIVRNDGMVVL